MDCIGRDMFNFAPIFVLALVWCASVCEWHVEQQELGILARLQGYAFDRFQLDGIARLQLFAVDQKAAARQLQIGAARRRQLMYQG